MNRIVVNESATEQFRGRSEACLVFDAQGNQLGYFFPTGGPRYEGYECPLSEAELSEIERQGGGRPLAEILRDLDQRA